MGTYSLMISIICSITSAIICPLVVFFIQKKLSSVRREVESRAEQRKKESLLCLKMIRAGNELSYAIAMALKRGKANGEVENAVFIYNATKDEYDQFVEKNSIEYLYN